MLSDRQANRLGIVLQEGLGGGRAGGGGRVLCVENGGGGGGRLQRTSTGKSHKGQEFTILL